MNITFARCFSQSDLCCIEGINLISCVFDLTKQAQKNFKIKVLTLNRTRIAWKIKNITEVWFFSCVAPKWMLCHKWHIEDVVLTFSTLSIHAGGQTTVIIFQSCQHFCGFVQTSKHFELQISYFCSLNSTKKNNQNPDF